MSYQGVNGTDCEAPVSSHLAFLTGTHPSVLPLLTPSDRVSPAESEGSPNGIQLSAKCGVGASGSGLAA